jgi:hypothetical protein
METLSELKKQVEELTKKIDVPKHSIPTFYSSEQSGLPHIEIRGLEYHFVVCERGSEHSRKTTTDKNELLFWIFDGITFSMACTEEVKNRRENEDFRVQLFQIQEDLIAKINIEYSERLKIKHDKILRRK